MWGNSPPWVEACQRPKLPRKLAEAKPEQPQVALQLVVIRNQPQSQPRLKLSVKLFARRVAGVIVPSSGAAVATLLKWLPPRVSGQSKPRQGKRLSILQKICSVSGSVKNESGQQSILVTQFPGLHSESRHLGGNLLGSIRQTLVLKGLKEQCPPHRLRTAVLGAPSLT